MTKGLCKYKKSIILTTSYEGGWVGEGSTWIKSYRHWKGIFV